MQPWTKVDVPGPGRKLGDDGADQMTEPLVFEAHSSYALGVLFTPDGRTLISAGMDRLITLWSVPGWQPVRTLQGHGNSVNSLSLSPDGQTLASGSTDATVRLWSLPEGRPLRTLHDRNKTVSAVRISPDGRWVAGASYGGRVVVWTLEGEAVAAIAAGKKNLSTVDFLAGQVLATGGLGGQISLWALPSGEPLISLPGHETAVLAVRALDGGQTLASLGYEGSVKFWDTTGWDQVRSLQVVPGAAGTPGVRGMAFSPDEKILAVALEGKVQLWSLQEAAMVEELPVSTRAVNGLAFSPDGRWLAAGAADGKIRIWDRM